MISRQEIAKWVEETYGGIDTTSEKVAALSVVHKIYDSISPKEADKGGKVRESVARMKKMFAAKPEIRKEDVILTVKLYLSQTDSRFIRYPHYFLKKGQGTDAIYEFDDWYEKYLEAKEAGTGRTSSSNTMQ